ncbi:hypothetical protein ES703_94405 [subsurface metagenome]
MGIRRVAQGVYNFDPTYKGDDSEGDQIKIHLSRIPLHTRATHRFLTWKESEGVADAFNVAMVFARQEVQPPLLLLYGKPGLGKTHLSLSIGWANLLSGRSTVYYHTEELLDRLRQGYKVWEAKDLGEYSPDSYDSIMNHIKMVNLFILDDLGAQKETEWAVAKLDEIVDYRYREGRAMVITANTLDIPDRILDRLKEGRVARLRGTSFRGKK